MKLKVIITLILLLVISVTATFALTTTSREKKNFMLDKGATLTVISNEGFIEVNEWNRNEAEVTIVKKVRARSNREARELFDNIQIDIEHSKDRLYIRHFSDSQTNSISLLKLLDPDNWSFSNRVISVSFSLKVPREVDLRLESDEGDVKVHGTEGDIEINVDEGDVEVESIEYRNMIVKIDEGDFRGRDIQGEAGRMKIYSDEGEVNIVDGKHEFLDIKCDEGDIYLKKIEVTELSIYTDEGDIDVDLPDERVKNNYYNLETDEGDVRIYAPAEIAMKYKLITEDGRIRSKFDIDIREYDDGARAIGEIGKRGIELTIYTDEGTISIYDK